MAVFAVIWVDKRVIMAATSPWQRSTPARCIRPVCEAWTTHLGGEGPHRGAVGPRAKPRQRVLEDKDIGPVQEIRVRTVADAAARRQGPLHLL